MFDTYHYDFSLALMWKICTIMSRYQSHEDFWNLVFFSLSEYSSIPTPYTIHSCHNFSVFISLIVYLSSFQRNYYIPIYPSNCSYKYQTRLPEVYLSLSVITFSFASKTQICTLKRKSEHLSLYKFALREYPLLREIFSLSFSREAMYRFTFFMKIKMLALMRKSEQT